MQFPTSYAVEGLAKIIVPIIKHSENVPLDRARSIAPVFFNEKMRMNRDSAILVLNTHVRKLGRPVSVCEPMCGSGVRGIRMALEIDDVEQVIMGDLNYEAVKLANENIRLNGVFDKVVVRLLEANLLMSLHGKPFSRFDYVDIDPYGTPSPYMGTAVRACVNGGLLALTATDMAPLCGVNPTACFRKYNSRSLRTKYCHESAIRIVAGALIRRAGVQNKAAKLLFSYAADHYVRLYFEIARGKKKVNSSLRNLGYVLHCFKCRNRKAAYANYLFDETFCDLCGSKMLVAGPMWLGDLADTDFCAGMLKISEVSSISANSRLMNIIGFVRDEVGYPPYFWNVDDLSSKLGISSLSMDLIIHYLKDKGFQAVRSHTDERGLKTNASIKTIENVIRGI